jgi:uncharacterized protein YeaO (DUF488 family)
VRGREGVAPELRAWFGHDPERFPAFAVRYRQELAREPARSALEDLARRASVARLTVLMPMHAERRAPGFATRAEARA